MECELIQDALLKSEPLDATAAHHLAHCAGCREFSNRVDGLETATRRAPTPPEASRSQQAFLARIGASAVAPVRSHSRRLRRWLGAGSLVAAAMTVALAIGFFALQPTQQAQAAPAVVEQLVEWNLSLSQAETLADRERLYSELIAVFQDQIPRSALTTDDQSLAEYLLANAAWLCTNDDPLDEAERFQEMADKLLTRLELVTLIRSVSSSELYAKLHVRVSDAGVTKNTKRAQRQTKVDEKWLHRLHLLEKRQARQEAKLEKLASKLPENAKKHVKGGRRKPKE